MLIPFLQIYLILIDSFPSFCHSSVVKVLAFKVHSPISASGLYRQNDRCHDSIPTSALLAVPQDCIDFWLSLFIDLPVGEVASLIAGFILQPVSSFVKGRSLLFWPFFRTAARAILPYPALPGCSLAIERTVIIPYLRAESTVIYGHFGFHFRLLHIQPRAARKNRMHAEMHWWACYNLKKAFAWRTAWTQHRTVY